MIVETLLAELDRPAFRAAMANDESAGARAAIAAELAGLGGRRNELAGMWADATLTRDEWAVAKSRLDERERTLRAELAALPAPVGRVDLDELREAWPLMTLDEQRELLGMFIDRVAVGRARPGLQTFDPERLASVETWWRRR
jgi:hypothetical protein